MESRQEECVYSTLLTTHSESKVSVRVFAAEYSGRVPLFRLNVAPTISRRRGRVQLPLVCSKVRTLARGAFRPFKAVGPMRSPSCLSCGHRSGHVTEYPRITTTWPLARFFRPLPSCRCFSSPSLLSAAT